MKPFTLLLVPLLFLSSCSIDWNDEKDKEITKLKEKILESNISNQEKCSEVAGKKFIQWKNDSENALLKGFWDKAYSSSDYNNFYNISLNKCFISIQETIFYKERDEIDVNEFLIDVFENKDVGFFSSYSTKDEKNKIASCKVWETECTSKDEFTNLKKINYMQ